MPGFFQGNKGTGTPSTPGRASLFNLLAKAVLQYDPNHIMENQKQHILMGNGVKYCLSFFLG